MNKSIQLGTPRTWSHAYPVAVQNIAASDAPAYACLQIATSTLVGIDTIYGVTQPTGVSAAKHLFNTPEALAPSAYGSAAADFGEVLISGTPVVNQEIGPVAGSWAMTTSGKGYLYLGGLANGVGRVAKTAAGATSDFPLIRITNNTGLPLTFGSIVGYSTPVNYPPGTLSSLQSWYYTTPTANKPFAVLLADLPNNTTGDAAPVGVVSCQVNVTDATHEYADVANGNRTNLVSGKTGQARILWRANGLVAGAGSLGVQWAIVALNHQPAASDDIRGVSYGTIPAATGSRDGALTPGVGAAKLYTMPTGAAGTAWAINTNPVVVENWMRGSIPSYKPLLLRPSRADNAGTQIYTVVSEGCAEIPSG